MRTFVKNAHDLNDRLAELMEEDIIDDVDNMIGNGSEELELERYCTDCGAAGEIGDVECWECGGALE